MESHVVIKLANLLRGQTKNGIGAFFCSPLRRGGPPKRRRIFEDFSKGIRYSHRPVRRFSNPRQVEDKPLKKISGTLKRRTFQLAERGRLNSRYRLPVRRFSNRWFKPLTHLSGSCLNRIHKCSHLKKDLQLLFDSAECYRVLFGIAVNFRFEHLQCANNRARVSSVYDVIQVATFSCDVRVGEFSRNSFSLLDRFFLVLSFSLSPF